MANTADRKEIRIRLNPLLWRRAKAAAALEDKPVQQYVGDLVEAALSASDPATGLTSLIPGGVVKSTRARPPRALLPDVDLVDNADPTTCSECGETLDIDGAGYVVDRPLGGGRSGTCIPCHVRIRELSTPR